MVTSIYTKGLMVIAVLGVLYGVYERGYSNATTAYELKLAKANQAHLMNVRELEQNTREAIAIKQQEIVKLNEDITNSTNDTRNELDKLYKQIDNYRASMPSNTKTNSRNAFNSRGWKLFKECTVEYTKLAEATEARVIQLHQWKGYSEAIFKD